MPSGGDSAEFGRYTRWEGDGEARFQQIGMNIGVMQPGGAGVSEEMTDGDEAYAGTSDVVRTRYVEGDLPG
jgi:hypothetical protein